MKRIAIVGAGKIGQMIADMLGQCGDYQIAVIDKSAEQLQRLNAATPVECLALDVNDPNAVAGALRGRFAVLSAAPFQVTGKIAEAAAMAGVHYLDLTEDVANTRRCAPWRPRAQSAFIPQCGLAPGFITIVGYDLARRFDELQDVRMRVGALPQYPVQCAQLQSDLEHRRGHQRVLRTVRGDRRTASWWRRRRSRSCEEFSLDGVTYEAFNTSGGLGTLCETLRGKVRNLNYRTIRYPGHAAIMKALLQDLRLRDRRDVLKDILEHALPIDPAGRGDRVRHRDRPARRANWCRRPTPTRSTARRSTAWTQRHPDHHRGRDLRRAGSAGRAQAPAAGLRAPGRRAAAGFPEQSLWPDLRAAPAPDARGPCRMNYRDILQEAGVPLASASAGALAAHTPIDGSFLTSVAIDDAAAIEAKIQAAVRAFQDWRAVPAPTRGELVRRFAERVRRDKVALGRLISLESGKTLTEGLGEVQEMIDICDFAVGLSRQLYGLTIASERPGHHLIERWHPLGPVGVIYRFQFSRGGVGLECGAGSGVRQHRDVEAVRKDAAVRARAAPRLERRDRRVSGAHRPTSRNW